MKIILYILLGLLVLIGGFFAWFFIFFLKVPAINITENSTQAERITAIDSWLSNLQQAHKFNGAVLITKDTTTLLAKGYGFTDYTLKEKLTPNSSFRLASVSKQFTAAGMMLLKEKGQIDYDDLVSKYVVNFPYEGVTIRHLLNQTSGVPDKYLDLAEKFLPTTDTLTNEKAVKLLIENAPKAKNAPNEIFEYSNTNYILLAYIIEIVSEQSFENYMQTNLFEPLKMNNTRVWNLLSATSTFEHKTRDFENFKGIASDIAPTNIDGVAGDGAVFSSITDMLIWDQFWYENDLISPENLQEAFKMPVLNNGKTSDYGFGWLVQGDVVWHNGAWLGANTIIVRNRKTKGCVVILDNSTNVFFDKIVGELKNALKG